MLLGSSFRKNLIKGRGAVPNPDVFWAYYFLKVSEINVYHSHREESDVVRRRPDILIFDTFRGIFYLSIFVSFDKILFPTYSQTISFNFLVKYPCKKC